MEHGRVTTAPGYELNDRPKSAISFLEVVITSISLLPCAAALCGHGIPPLVSGLHGSAPLIVGYVFILKNCSAYKCALVDYVSHSKGILSDETGYIPTKVLKRRTGHYGELEFISGSTGMAFRIGGLPIFRPIKIPSRLPHDGLLARHSRFKLIPTPTEPQNLLYFCLRSLHSLR
ncbi:hypothetical protein V1477_009307 [Vespula maculifrons]|uniref:Uncharacterized protein n=1 Tax=Vespula maculifrons TaxID=7453 RepID=A0ABD2CBM4_VESMC